MKRKTVVKSITAVVLTLAMVASSFFFAPTTALAAIGDKKDVGTGLQTGTNIDTTDTISLPIELYDYYADGMLFEYCQSNETDLGPTADYVHNYTDCSYGTYGENYCPTSETIFKSTSDFDVITKNPGDSGGEQYIRVRWAGDTSKTSDRVEDVITNFSSDFGDSTVSIDDIRYLTLVYRLQEKDYYDKYDSDGNERDGAAIICFSPAGSESEISSWYMLPDTVGSNEWIYVVVDLKTNNLKNYTNNISSIYMHMPMRQSGEYMDIAYIAYCDNKEEAEKFGEYAITKGSDQGDNRAYSMLYGSRNEDSKTIVYESAADAYPNEFEHFNLYTETEGTTYDYSELDNLGYKLYGTFQEGVTTIGLLESSLVNGKPVYKEETVTYLAKLMQATLTIDERTSDGWAEYKHVHGQSAELFGGTDFAEALRARIEKLGSYSETEEKAKNLIGTWDQCKEYITTYFDAAYFMLNNIYTANSYNIPQDDYHYLVLSKAVDENGKDMYIFDGGFTTSATASEAECAVSYDTDKKTIYNTSGLGKTYYKYGDKDSEWTTMYPFLPITDHNNAAGQTPTYPQESGANNLSEEGETYVNRDYNYVMVSEGEFVYYADDQLFFEFEGDDDVYLFINGELVLDIGACHGISSAKMNINDYVEAARIAVANGSTDPRDIALALEDGETYSFNFYYMERHGTGANIRIATNIRVTDPAMETHKTAYQDGNQLAYGDSIDKDKIVEYGFAMTNVGNNRLYNLSFKDDDIGVTIDYENGLTIKEGYNGVRVFDTSGGTLEASDLKAIAKGTDSNGNYVEKEVDFESNAELIAFLKDMTDSNVVESGGGLWQGSTIEIRGFAYKLTAEQSAKGVFDNIVHSSAWDSKSVGEGEYLIGQATMRVFVLAEPMYYQWANHEITISQTEFIEDILVASKTANNVLAGKVTNLTTSNVNKIEECTQKGLSTDYSQVTIDDSYNITVNYTSTGSRVFYVKVTYNNSSASVIVPVLVNVTDVKDSVYVLDYGLKVDLTENNEFFKNDTVTVPARGTNAAILAIGNETPSYGSNTIDFTAYTDTENPLGDYGDYNLEITEKHLETVTELKTNTPYAIISHHYNMALTDEDEAVVTKSTSLSGIVLEPDADITDIDKVVPWYYNGINLIVNSPNNAEGYLNLTETVASIGAYSAQDTVNNVYLNTSANIEEFTIQNTNYTNTYLNQYGGTPTATVATRYSQDGSQTGGSSWYFKEIVPLSSKLTYTPGGTTSKFMEGLDTIWTAVSVQDSEYMTSPVLGTVDINHEVQMYKKVTVLPATVVYYEDDYPAITYYNTDGSKAGNTFTTGSSSDLSQSADQNQEYGQDEAYQTGSAAQSGGTLTTIALTDIWNMASFEFTGTGFELISRTNAKDSGVIAVLVKDSNENTVYDYPVITEFDNGGDGGEEGIYQVPVIRVDNLTYGKYTVVITGIQDFGEATTYFYMDGLRIFQPLGVTNENYTPEENGATFTELRDLIVAGDAAVAEYTLDSITVSSGTVTWTENRNGTDYDGETWTGNKVASVNDYLTLGPNNEVYMDGSSTKEAIVFYVNETENSVHNLQLAVRGIDAGLFYGSGSTGIKAVIQYGIINSDGTYAWAPLATVTSATEQYYTIDYTKCPYVEGKGYQIAIQVTFENLDQDTTTDETQIIPAFASYSSIKLNGLEVNTDVDPGEATTLAYVNGILTDTANNQPVDEASVFSFRSIRAQLLAEDVVYDEDIDDGVEDEDGTVEDDGNTDEDGTVEEGGNTDDDGNVEEGGSTEDDEKVEEGGSTEDDENVEEDGSTDDGTVEDDGNADEDGNVDDDGSTDDGDIEEGGTTEDDDNTEDDGNTGSSGIIGSIVNAVKWLIHTIKGWFSK